MVSSSNRTSVRGVIQDSVLILSTGAAGKAGEITVEAESGGLKTRKSFVVITTGQETGFGKEFQVVGRFTDQRGIYEHSVILDGPCTITGDRGYSNQAFFVAVLDSRGDLVVDWTHEPVQAVFPRGLYTLSASLFNPATYFFYPYTEGDHDGYVLHVSCPEAYESIDTIAGILGIDLRDALTSDGRLSLVHAVLLLRYSAGLMYLTELQKAALNLAGHEDPADAGIADAVMILRKMAGLE